MAWSAQRTCGRQIPTSSCCTSRNTRLCQDVWQNITGHAGSLPMLAASISIFRVYAANLHNKSSVPSPGQAPPELQTRRWRPSSRKITGTNVAVNCHRPLPSCGHSGRVPLYLTSPRISPCHTVLYRCRSILAAQLLASAASSSISKSTSSMGIACA